MKSSTEPQMGEALSRIQSHYGAGPEKPREIKKTLGKDDFLRIMITQMKHQDPTQPFKAEQFASELAQYASVEQLQNVNLALNKLSTQNQPMERLALTGLIGKTVTVDRERFPHADGKKDNLSFVLPDNAASVKIALQSETGEVVLEKELGNLRAGENSFEWDGMQQNTLPAKSGNYLYRIEAVGENGKKLRVNPQVQSQVVGVSFEGTEPAILVGNPAKPDKVTMRNVIRIEAQAPLVPGAKPLQAVPQGAALPSEAFQTEEGAEINRTSVQPEMATFESGRPPVQNIQQVLNKYQQPKSVQSLGTEPELEVISEKGFPHGLNDPDEPVRQKGGEKP